MTVADAVKGRGAHSIARRLITPHDAVKTDNHVLIRAADKIFRLTANGAITVTPFKRWTAYGGSAPATMIEIKNASALPFDGSFLVEAGSAAD
jgi:hypothetical protein